MEKRTIDVYCVSCSRLHKLNQRKRAGRWIPYLLNAECPECCISGLLQKIECAPQDEIEKARNFKSFLWED